MVYEKRHSQRADAPGTGHRNAGYVVLHQKPANAHKSDSRCVLVLNVSIEIGGKKKNDSTLSC